MEASLPLNETYNAWLVLLSVTIAAIASFTAFGITERSRAAAQRGRKVAWLLFGAVSMGVGVWAMHFIGMLALKLPIPVSYDLEITIVSIIPAIFASITILWRMTQSNHTQKKLLLNGILLGAGIGLMHHTGMAAVRMDAIMVHDKALSALSILFAIIAATIALKIQTDTANLSHNQFLNKPKIISAFIMGSAISGMHYAAMAAVKFFPEDNMGPIQGISQNGLAIIVSVVVLAIASTALFIPLLLRYRQTTKELALLIEKEKKALELLLRANKAARQGSFEVNFQTGAMQTSDDYSVLLGYEPLEFIGSFEECLRDTHPEDRKRVQAQFEKAMETGEPVKIEYRRKTKDGHWLWISTSGETVEWDGNHQKPLKMTGIHTDISERKRSEEIFRALAESGSSETENIFKKIVRLLAQSHDMRYAMISLINSQDRTQADTLAIWANGDFIDNLSYPLKGSPCEKVTEEGVCFYPENIQALFPRDTLLIEMEAISYVGVPLKNNRGKTIGIINIIDDKPIKTASQTTILLDSLATRASMELERLEAEKELKLLARVFSETQNGVAITDANDLIVDVNPAFSQITGYSHEEAIGQNPRILKSGKQKPQPYAGLQKALDEQGFWKGEIWNHKKNGELYAEHLTISILNDDAGNTLNYLGIFSDITHSKEQQKELELLAHYDVLTKLPNRALFYDRFLQAVAHSKRAETLLAVCFLDLDNFKPVNDAYGHTAGDQLLIEVAERIKANIREEDTVSRQGGDEFTLLLGGFESLQPCEQILKRILETLAKPYQIDGETIDISASLGVTLYPQDKGDIDTLVRHADQAMYQAKLSGKNRYHLFNPEQDQQVSIKHQRLEEIQQALMNNEFSLYYQPKVNMKTGEVYGAEALLRWIHPEKGLIPPLDFLPIIEETQLEIQIGEWVIEQALAQIALWNEQGLSLEVSVNIASYHLQSASFISQLEKALSKQPTVNPDSLQLEILESSALGDIQVINGIIKTCQGALGVKVALDDFGTGYSSLTHLRNLPAETIKIDQTFVRDLLDDPDDYTITDGIIALSDSFDREVIAEGVETTEHGLMLLMMGCNHAQGYGIARPMPAGELLTWLNNYSPNEKWMRFGNTEHNPKECRTQQLILATRQWKRRFEKAIQSPPDELQSWPVIDQTKCPCGNWIKRETREQLLDESWLAELDQAHNNVHVVANSLKILYQEKKLAAALEGLPRLKEEFAKMHGLLERAN